MTNRFLPTLFQCQGNLCISYYLLLLAACFASIILSYLRTTYHTCTMYDNKKLFHEIRMIDVESQSSKKNIMSLRKRKKIPQSSLPSSSSSSLLFSTDNNANPFSEQQHKLREHAKLIKKIRASANDDNDDDDDEAAREMKQKIRAYQIQKSNDLAYSLFKFLIAILVTLVFVYTLVLFIEVTEEPSIINSLMKVLRILLGMRQIPRYLASENIVATSSVPKSTIDEYLIPSWSRKINDGSNQYLVPESDMEVRHILHESLKLQHERKIGLNLYDEQKMHQFLLTHGQQCGDPDIAKKFDELKQSGNFINGSRNLWLWCMIYSGEAFGQIDIDNYYIELSSNLLRKVSLGRKPWGIENLLIDPNIEEESDIDQSLTLALSTSIMFVSKAKSKVAQGMIRFLLDTTPFNEDTLIQELNRLLRLVGEEGENHESWVSLKAHCISKTFERFDDQTMAKVCLKDNNHPSTIAAAGESKCCYLVM